MRGKWGRNKPYMPGETKGNGKKPGQDLAGPDGEDM